MRDDLILEPWQIRQPSGCAEDEFSESIFFTGNGRMGVRGYLPCGRAELPVQTGLYVAGVFGEIKPGITDFVCLPTPFCEDYFINGSPVSVSAVSRTLDLHSALVRFEFSVASPSGSAHVRYERFFHKGRTGLCLQRTVLTAKDAASFRISSGVLLSSCNSPIPDDQTKDNSETVQLSPLTGFAPAPDGFSCSFLINGTALRVSESCLFSLSPQETTATEERLASDFEFSLSAGESITLDKLCYVSTSRDVDPNILPPPSGWNYYALLAEHLSAWAGAWADCDMVIPASAELQSAVRYSMLQLICSCSRNDATVSIGARGITHGRYKGCYFWDTDIFMFPFFLHTDPQAAKNLCLYRTNALPQAKIHSAKMNTLGARYPWMAAFDGSEQCESWDIGCSEVHITADVVYMLNSYCTFTGDHDFYLDHAAEVYVETARFWMSRYTIRRDGTADLLNCKGPDEYCGVTNNNLYTNVFVQHNLTLAAKAAADLEHLRPAVFTRLGISREEVSSWLSLRKKIRWPHDPHTGHLTTDDHFHLLEDVEPSSLKSGAQASYKTICFDAVQRLKVVKQADVLLLMTRLPDLFTREEKLTAWADFEPICLHDSTLSFASHALFAAMNGLEKEAFSYLSKALLLDLRDVMSNTGHEGLHLACMGEAWHAARVFFAANKR